jgi:hypothetical protein
MNGRQAMIALATVAGCLTASARTMTVTANRLDGEIVSFDLAFSLRRM